MVTQLLGCGAKPRDFFRVSDALFKANLTTKHAPWHTHKHGRSATSAFALRPPRGSRDIQTCVPAPPTDKLVYKLEVHKLEVHKFLVTKKTLVRVKNQ